MQKEKSLKQSSAASDLPRAVIAPASAAGPSEPLKIQSISANGALVPEKSESLDIMHAPDPVGHFMLVALPKVEVRTEKGIYIPDTVTDRERAASVVGTVIEMGPDCYKDAPPQLPPDMPEGVPVMVIAPRPRFPSGPWCKKGDTVLFSRYAGKRFTIEGVEFRMLADDEITATIPSGARVGGL